MISRNFFLVVSLGATLSVITPAVAQESHEDVEVDHHSLHKNDIALFIGDTRKTSSSKHHLTVGAEYFRLIVPSGNLGVGGTVEAVLADHTEWIVAFLAEWKPVEHLWIRGGPGIEYLREEEEHHDSAKRSASGSGETTWTSAALMRGMLGYEIKVDRVIFTPTAGYDFFRTSTALIMGISIGFGF